MYITSPSGDLPLEPYIKLSIELPIKAIPFLLAFLIPKSVSLTIKIIYF